MKYQHLFSPLKIRHLLLTNRVVIPAMHSNLANTDGSVSENTIKHYQQRACGGAGLVIVEAAVVSSPVGRQGLADLVIDHPRYISGLSRLADAIHLSGPHCLIQLFHSGAQTLPAVTGGEVPVSPSGLPVRVTGVVPRQLSRAEIKDIREAFIRSALYAERAGFDGVEIHAAHGYLLSEFLSPLTNKREDEYGGNLENRARLLTEIIGGIREHSPHLLISVRVNGSDFLPGGIEEEEASSLASVIEQAGADLLNISAGMYDSGLTSIESNAYPEGWKLYLCKTIKSKVHIPVAGGGVILTPEAAEQALAAGNLDLVYVGRATLADPEWPKKAQDGREEDIRPCIRCNTCTASNFTGLPTRCAVNPEVGRYGLVRVSPTQRLRVMVIGGGPAGMVAAITAALRGHQVKLIEKSHLLGGQLGLACLPPHKERIALYRDYLVNQLMKTGVDISTGVAADTNLINSYRPDVLIIAVGSTSSDLMLSYNDDSVTLLDMAEALSQEYPGAKCLVAGGGESGLEVALTLAVKGADVCVAEAGNILAPSMEKKNRRSLLNNLKEAAVTTMVNTRVIGIRKGEVVLSSLNSNKDFTLPCDYLIPACGRTPRPIAEEWLTLAPRVKVVGDSQWIGSIASAVFTGFAAGLWA